MRSRPCPGPYPPDNPCASAGGRRPSVPNVQRPSIALLESPRRPVSGFLAMQAALSDSEPIGDMKAARPIPEADRTSQATPVGRTIGKAFSARGPQFQTVPWPATDARTTPDGSLSWYQTPRGNRGNDQ